MARWQRILQVLLGLLWLFDGALQFQAAMFRPDFFGMMLLMGPAGPPVWLGDLDTRLEPFLTAHAWGVNWVFASLQVLLGLGLLFRPTVRWALAVSVPWALAVWLIGEAAGGIFLEGASALTGAPGPALVYALVAVLVWPRRRPDGTAAHRAGPDSAASDRAGPDSAGGDRAGPNSAAGRGLLPRPLPELAWALLWVGTALLEAESLNLRPRSASDAITAAAQSGPGWFGGASHDVARLIGSHGTLFALSAGVVQALIGLGVFARATRRAALVAAVVAALAYGAFGQDFGGIFSQGLLGVFHSGASDPASAPITVILALSLWPRRTAVPVPVPVPAGPEPGGARRPHVNRLLMPASGGT
jgi:hypothetical protein